MGKYVFDTPFLKVYIWSIYGGLHYLPEIWEFLHYVYRHAGTYTPEEVALITKDKLIRLQSLYIEQFKRLQHVMRENRRKYIHTAKLERETLGEECLSVARRGPPAWKTAQV